MRITDYDINIPDDLLIKLEEEKVVLFVGAGISTLKPSMLPDFEELIKNIYSLTGTRFLDGGTLDRNLS